MEEGYFTNSAGERFYYVQGGPEKPKAVILAVHGYAEHTGRYRHVMDFMNSRGFSFYMMENRGHGRSPGKRGHIDRYDQFTDDLHEFRIMPEKAAREHGVPLFLLGHSNGSLISARYALAHGDGIRGLVLSGIPIRAAVKVNPVKLKLGFFLAGIAPKLTLPSEIDPYTLCHDEKVTDLLSRAGEFSHPVLFQHGGDDRACDPPSAVEFYEKIASGDKRMQMYEGLWHEIFNEPEKEKILDTAASWIEERI